MAKPIESTARVHWEGDRADGEGRVALGSGEGEFEVTWRNRTDPRRAYASPEEFLAAAYGSCYSMWLANSLSRSGTEPAALDVDVTVTFYAERGITQLTVGLAADVPGLDYEALAAEAAWAKDNCPVGLALKGVHKTLVMR